MMGEDRQGSFQQQGRPLEKWEEDEEAEGGEGELTSSDMKEWIRSLAGYNFDPDAVPDPAMANFLGGTVSVPANRPGWHRHTADSSVFNTAEIALIHVHDPAWLKSPCAGTLHWHALFMLPHCHTRTLVQ